MGLARTPETFACAVSVAGISDLVTFLEEGPPYWSQQGALWVTRVGNFRTQEGREFLHQRSPCALAKQIARPLLVAHGANPDISHYVGASGL